jgi:hypothetical protein
MKIRTPYILLCLLLPALSSCIFGKVDEVMETPTDVQVTFALNVKSPVATKGLDEIDPLSLFVLVYDTEGNFVKELPILNTRIEDGKVRFDCALNVHLPSDASEATPPQYRFMVVTNSTNQQYGLTYDKNGVPAIEQLDFAYYAYKYSSGSTIPMWGVKTYTIQYEDGKLKETQDLGVIDVLRSGAKVSVELVGKALEEGYTIGDIKINRVAAAGYSVPGNWNQTSQTTDLKTGAKGYVKGFRPNNIDPISDVSAFFPAGEDATMKYIYIPEITNDEELAISLVLHKDGETFEFTYDKGIKFAEYDDAGLPTDNKFNVIRNNHYEYKIRAVHTNLDLLEVEYNTLPMIEEEVEIGGEVKYLVLNTDLVQIYGENIDASTLQFTSSSRIVNVELKDTYGHDPKGSRFGNQPDGTYAYYVSKFGQRVQLGTDPGFDIADKEAAMAREQVILENINATAEEQVLQGDIVINSPFIGESDNEIEELKEDSHYDTVRYLEFEVTNEQGLTATFRVEQYPPLVITNIEGYFSYREDFRIGDLEHTYDINQFSGNYSSCLTMPVDNGEPTHYHNPVQPFFVLAGFYPYHIHEWDPVTKRIVKNPTQPTASSKEDGTCPDVKKYDGFDEIISGLMERDYHRVEEYKGSPVSGIYHRTHYLWSDGAAFIGGNIGKPQNYYQNVGPVFEQQHEVDDIDPETGEVIGKKTITKYYRRHYTGNSFNIFYSKFVELPINSNGTAVIGSQRCDYNYTAPWYMWAVWYPNGNHRMYHIRTNTTSSEYNIGRPKMMDVDGRIYTAEGEANSRMVSPSFMIASMLGETQVPYDRDGYIVPKEGGLYPLAQRQCEQYVETHFEDLNNNGTWEEGEPVIHFNDWRLPTKAEIELIAKYQNNSRAIDFLLDGETYYCASIVAGEYSAETVLSNPIEGATKGGYYMRCVRDVYED